MNSGFLGGGNIACIRDVSSLTIGKYSIQVKDSEMIGVTSAEEMAAFLKTYEEVY